MTINIKEFVHKLFFDKHGRLVLIQLPNLPLSVFILASVFAKIFSKGSTNHFFMVLSFGSIFTWAWSEIFAGLNIFRRLLGIVVLGLSLISALMYLHT